MNQVLVTGASRGLGLEFVRQYAAAGWRVIACARDPQKASELASVARCAGWKVRVETMDVTNPMQVAAVAASLADQAIDVLINNAGDIGPRGAQGTQLHRQFFGSLDFDAWRAVLEVNLLAPIRVAEQFLEHVQRSAQKKMIFLSSSAGSIAEGSHPVFAYCSSKAALNKAVSMLAMSVRDRGIIAAAVCPGHAKTDLGGAGASVEVHDSISGLRKCIDAMTLADSGTFTRYNGERVAW